MKGISEMYASYEALSYWPFLSAPTQGIRVDFVRAENSSYVWPMDDIERLKAYGHRVHHLPLAGKGASVLQDEEDDLESPYAYQEPLGLKALLLEQEMCASQATGYMLTIQMGCSKFWRLHSPMHRLQHLHELMSAGIWRGV